MSNYENDGGRKIKLDQDKRFVKDREHFNESRKIIEQSKHF